MSSPFIKPGTYRIEIGQHGQQALLTVAKSATMGEGLIVQSQAQAIVDDTRQQWVVAYNPDSDTYTVQSISTGMYIVCEYPCTDGSNVRLSAKAQQWQLFHDPASPQGVAWFRVPKTDLTVHLYSNAPSTNRIVMSGKYAAGRPEQDCIFDPVVNPGAATVYSPLITNPMILLPGIYHIRSLSTKNLMAFEEVPHPQITKYSGVCAVGAFEVTGDLYQQWKLTYVPVSKTFYLLNIGADKYLTSVTPSLRGAYLIPASQPQHWDIRQAEFDSPTKGLFAIHIPETDRLLCLASDNPASGTMIGIWTTGYPLLPQERWVFEPIEVPTGSTNIGRPPVVIPPLVQGVYKLRNVGTNNLVTLPPAAKGPNLEDGPNLVSNPDADASDTNANLYQQWIVTYDDRSQTYIIENIKTGTYITSRYALPDQAILQGGAIPQLWDIRQIAYDGQPEAQLVIQLPATNHCFNVWYNNSAPNTRVGLVPRSEALADVKQRFIFEPVINPIRGPEPKFFGDYVLRNIAGGTVLDLSSTSSKYPSTVGRPANSNLSQRWAISQMLGDPAVCTIRSVGLQLYLSRPPRDADLPVGSVTVTANPTAWVLHREGGSFRVSVEESNLSLDLTDGNATDGTKVQLKGKHDVPHFSLMGPHCICSK